MISAVPEKKCNESLAVDKKRFESSPSSWHIGWSVTSKGKKPRLSLSQKSQRNWSVHCLHQIWSFRHRRHASGIFRAIFFWGNVHQFLRILNASRKKHTYLTKEKWWFDETSYNSTKWETLIQFSLLESKPKNRNHLNACSGMSYFSYKSKYWLHSTCIPLITEQFNVSIFFVRVLFTDDLKRRQCRDYRESFSNSPAVIPCFTSYLSVKQNKTEKKRKTNR